MMNLHHPDNERLSALASRDDDATADVALASHVESCARCTELLGELGALRMSLAELPDLRPPRPLRLVPPLTDAGAAAGGAGWIRRLFAPAMSAGAALALVGVIGTAAPIAQQMSQEQEMFQDAGTNLEGSRASEAAGGDMDYGAPAPGNETRDAAAGEDGVAAMESQGGDEAEHPATRDRQLPAERSPWPMLLFTGVALMIGAALLRWILVPRVG